MAEVAFWLILAAILPTPPAPESKPSAKENETLTSKLTKKSIFGVERAIDIAESVFPSSQELADLEQGMEGCQHGWFESCFEGAKLHYRKWLPHGKPKAIVIWMHGISAHSGRAIILDDGKRKLDMPLQCDAWLNEEYALYSFDHYGHGYSEGLRWFVPTFEINRDDYISFVKMVTKDHEEGTPLFLSGESYGGNLTLHVAKYFQDNPAEKPKGFDSIILVAPAIIPPDLPPKPIVLLLTSLAKHYPTWIPFFMPNPVSTDRIWRDKRVVEKFDSVRMREMGIEGGGRPYRLATAVSLLEALDKVQTEIISNLKVPFCVVHGENDFAVPISGTDLLMQKAQTPMRDRVLKRQPGGYHDLLADPLAEDTMKVMVSFAKKRVAAKRS